MFAPGLQSPPACIHHLDTVQVNLTQRLNWIQFWIHVQWKPVRGGTKHIGHKILCRGVLPAFALSGRPLQNWQQKQKDDSPGCSGSHHWSQNWNKGGGVWWWRLELHFDSNVPDYEQANTLLCWLALIKFNAAIFYKVPVMLSAGGQTVLVVNICSGLILWPQNPKRKCVGVLQHTRWKKHKLKVVRKHIIYHSWGTLPLCAHNNRKSVCVIGWMFTTAWATIYAAHLTAKKSS